MLTLFTIPKPFHGHIDVIQRNAIRSWTLLRPKPEIILLSDEEGVREVAEEFGLRYFPDIARNEYGTPLINDIYENAQRLASYDLICCINADIVVLSDFMPAVLRCTQERSRFLMVGQRWDLDLDEPLDFDSTWENRLLKRVESDGNLHAQTGIDYFVFPRGIWGDIPPFALGRTAWDNWLIYRARSLGIPLIDATRSVRIIHQNHDFSHIPGGTEKTQKTARAKRGPEQDQNLELAGGTEHIFNLKDTTHWLTERGLRRKLDAQSLRRRYDTFPVVHPRLAPLYNFFRTIFIKPVRFIVSTVRRR